MCHINITLRVTHTLDQLKAKPGVYFSHEEIRDYWTALTGEQVDLSLVPGTITRLLKNGYGIHQNGKTLRFETEALRAARLEEEEQSKQTKIKVQAEKDTVTWARKRAKVEALREELKSAERDLKLFEDNRQDSILRVVSAA